MATEQSVAEHIATQCRNAGSIRIRKMFGEYALYCDEKVVALICDNRLFVKPTDAGKAFANDPEEALAYPGSKKFLLIEEHLWDDAAWLGTLIGITAAALPLPKKKKRISKS